MSPEYVDAVDAVRWGWSFCIVFALPALLIWSTTLFRFLPTVERRFFIGCVVFGVACFSCWFLVVFHANHIQSAKKRNMKNDEEMRDFTSDTWKVFAPVTAIPFAVLYCGINQAAASLLWFLVALIRRLASRFAYHSPILASTDCNVENQDSNPYTPPREP